jgi:ABC-type dipeptide/oligopeptide/nickel transport system permease component
VPSGLVETRTRDEEDEVRWARFIAGRLAYFVLGLAFVTTISFFLVRVVPSNPVLLVVGQSASKATIAAETRKLGLDRPILTQYVQYIGMLLHGNFGTSILSGDNIASDLRSRWPATVELGLAGITVAVLWGVPFGALAAVRQGGWIDRTARVISSAGIAVPDFWLGSILILVFFARLHVVPAPIGETNGPIPEHITGMYAVDALLSGNWAALGPALTQLILPAITLGLVAGAPLMRVTRTFMVEALDSQYVRAARALGIPNRRIVIRHALRNVLVPITAMFAAVCGWVLAGDVLVEYVFSWPGIGQYAVQAISSADYQVVMAVVLISAVTYLLVYLVTDVLQMVVDPRTRP